MRRDLLLIMQISSERSGPSVRICYEKCKEHGGTDAFMSDMAYILAFLLGLAVCCGDRFLEADRVFGTLCVFLCAAGLLIPALTLFSPAAGYGLFRRRIYIPAVLFIIVFFIRTAGMLPVLLLCLELFAFLISFFFAVEEAELDIAADTG